MKTTLLSILAFAVMSSAQAYEACNRNIDLSKARVKSGEYVGDAAEEAQLYFMAGASSIYICKTRGGSVALIAYWSVIGRPGKYVETIDLLAK